MHLADRVERVRLQMLDVVQLGELAPVVGRAVLVELLERLAAQVVAVHQEEHAFGLGELDQPVDETDRRVCLACPGGHLDQGARLILGEGFLFKVVYGLYLRRPQSRRVERVRRGHFAQSAS